MQKLSKTILGFALLGLAIAGACYLYAAFYDYTKPTNGFDVALVAVSMILCPPQLLFSFCIDCEVIGWGGFIMYSIIGVLNAALYAMIGYMVFALRSRVRKRRTPLNVAVPTIIPFFVAFYSIQGTMLFGDHYGFNAVPRLLVGWCAVLFVSGAWLNHVLFRQAKIRLPLVATVGAIAAILSIWLWQRLAYKSLLPATGLRYGYFLTPEGAHAHLWTLTYPFWVGAACLTVCCVATLISGWRAGLRLSLLCLIPWWLSVFVIFALPSMYLDGQGNASIFI